MFTGIVQHLGIVKEWKGSRLRLSSPLGAGMGDSVAVNGVCLTAVGIDGSAPQVLLDFDVSEETMRRTTLGNLAPGHRVNLEPAARVGDPLGGHIVLGHVDATGTLLSVVALPGSKVYEFSLPPELRQQVVSKGSIAVDGISLTVVDAREASFTAAVIPHTEANTTLGAKSRGDAVNLETDILAKHVEKLVSPWKPAGGARG